MFALAIMNGLVIGVIYALAALGVSLVVGIMKVINFAHGELYILAGYFSYMFADTLDFNLFLSMLLAVGLVFLFGILIEYTLIRPTYGNDMYSLIHRASKCLSADIRSLSQQTSQLGKRGHKRIGPFLLRQSTPGSSCGWCSGYHCLFFDD
jgi:branched-subunit amino acid ABC-type transport system permease component